MINFYAGMTAYLEDTPRVRERLSVLAEVMSPLQNLVPAFGEDLFGQGTVLDGNKCTFIAQNNNMFQNPPDFYPSNTPAWRQRVTLNDVLISGRPGIRIHIPVTHTESLEVGNMVNFALSPLFAEMFESDLCGIKIKHGMNTDTLDQLPVITVPLPAYCAK